MPFAELDEIEEEEEEELHHGGAAAAAQDGGGDASDVSGATFDGNPEDLIDDDNPMKVLLAAVAHRLQTELKTTGPATDNWLLAHLKQNDFWLLTAQLPWVRRPRASPTPHPAPAPRPRSSALHPRPATIDGPTAALSPAPHRAIY